MAGTNSSQQTSADTGPAIILVGPQLGENIGAAARAMLNCGLEDLRLVAPRDPWPNPAARPAASGADRVLDAARVYPDCRSAVADLQQVYATTARPRDLAKHVVTARQAATEMRQQVHAGSRVGVLFGRERIGLINDELTLANTLVTVPLNPSYSSLNLAQAVLLLAYEWRLSGDQTPPRVLQRAGNPAATQAQVASFFDHLETALDATGFFKTQELRPSIVRNLRNLFQRADLNDQEVRTLHGVITSLVGRPKHRL